MISPVSMVDTDVHMVDGWYRCAHGWWLIQMCTANVFIFYLFHYQFRLVLTFKPLKIDICKITSVTGKDKIGRQSNMTDMATTRDGHKD